MKWQLTKEENGVRTYENNRGGTIETKKIYTDEMGNNWWGFSDLFKIPFIRIAVSKQIADLYITGVTVEDLERWDNEEIAILKSNDPEKYEKLYAVIIERRKMRQSVVDPIKKHLALCTVYVLEEGEAIDYFDMAQTAKKMEVWSKDPMAVAFFLNWHTNSMENYTNSLKAISQIVLKNNP